MEGFMPIGFIIVIIIVIYVSAKKNAEKLQSEQGKKANITHKECVEEASQDCIHIYDATPADRKACKNCGHKNEKKAKRCSVCGTKLWW